MLNGTRPRRDDFASDLQRWHADLLELPERNVRRRIGA